MTPTNGKSYFFDIQRRVVAHKTVESWDEVPHGGLHLDLDVTELLNFLDGIKMSPEFSNLRLTINSLLLKVIAEGLKKSPAMNAHIRYSRGTAVGEVTPLDEVNIAVPFQTPGGCTITPVLADVGGKSLQEIGHAMEALNAKVQRTDVDMLLLEAGLNNSLERLKRGDLRVLRRLYANLFGKARLTRPSRSARRQYRQIPEDERITPENLLSATVLVSNVGSALRGVSASVALLEIIPPQTTALGLGTIRRRPWVAEDAHGREEIAIRSVLPMALYIDHRAMDLEHVTGFIRRVEELCRRPEQLAGAMLGESHTEVPVYEYKAAAGL